MKKLYLPIVGIVLVIVCTVTVLLQGRTFTLSIPSEKWDGTEEQADAFQVDFDDNIVTLTDRRIEDGALRLTFTGENAGRTFIEILLRGKDVYLDRFYVHASGAIAKGTLFGESAGAWCIPWAVFLYLALLLWHVIRTFRKEVRQNLYQYRNIRNLGLIIYLSALLVFLAPLLFRSRSIDDTIRAILNSAASFATFALPVAFVVSILVTISSIQLMRKEGRTWRNMLGFFLGLLLCVCTLFPTLLGNYLQQAAFVDVHKESSIALYIELAVENGVFILVAYLECILLGTILLAYRAARRTPAYDKDYIVIHGCQIREDGKLTKLLQGRADKAVEFARKQQEAGGKAPVFIPSGGKGSDEIVSEAEAIRNYLVEEGIPEERILMEDRSVSTYENLKFSQELIRMHSEDPEPKIAFATTNYHVFRSGVLATQQGLRAEGLGSRTKRYFWINAFVREFIATVFAERKIHLAVLSVVLLIMFAMLAMQYLSVQL